MVRLERRRWHSFSQRQRRRLSRARARGVALALRAVAIGVRTAKVGVAVVVVSLLLGGTAFAATSLYNGFGAPRVAQSQLAWADRNPRYAITNCGSCHAPQTALNAQHAGLSCELCHTPTVDHPGPVSNAIAALPASTSATCVACHEALPGRPSSVPLMSQESHYPLVDCLRCHDPHSAEAALPPEVTHPLAHLPACTTCHSPAGLKRYPEGHQPAVDTVCLACHKPTLAER